MKEAARNILKEYKLKVTSARLAVLEIFLANPKKAFSTQEILRLSKKKMNRSTLYRTLETLLKQYLIKKMKGPNGEIIYSIQGKKECNSTTHPHLKCSLCGTIECLPSYPSYYVNELTSFGVHEMNVMLSGICKSCSYTNEPH